MKRLIFNQEELSELEVLQIKGGGSDDTVPTVQYACGNSAIGCGGGVTQLYCMNYTIGCGSSELLVICGFWLTDSLHLIYLGTKVNQMPKKYKYES